MATNGRSGERPLSIERSFQPFYDIQGRRTAGLVDLEAQQRAEAAERLLEPLGRA